MTIADSSLAHLVRLAYESTPVYIDPAGPDWFVPSDASDRILSRLLQDMQVSPSAPQADSPAGLSGPGMQTLLRRVAPQRWPEYTGRNRPLEALKEIWFHLTNACNMSCAHCLFCSGSGVSPKIDRALLDREIPLLYDQGCTTFFFTGGEPFLYPDFTGLVDSILARDNTSVVVLTNGSLLEKHASWLRDSGSGRLRLQISIDGMRENHDNIRGDGAFDALRETLEFLRPLPVPVTLAMSVSRDNVHEMTELPRFAHDTGVANVHFMWLFQKGNAAASELVAPDIAARELIQAYEFGLELGVEIDNVQILREQVFSAPGTRYDLSNAGWESLAVGPDGTLYPSPALIGEPELACGSVSHGILTQWREHPVLQRVRAASLLESKGATRDPLAFLTGGGDMDHSYIAGKTFCGHDPWLPVYRTLALYLIAREAQRFPSSVPGALRTRMGERLINCSSDPRALRFTRSNCVLTKETDERAPVNQFYSKAAEKANEDILNPVSYDSDQIAHIPEAGRVRSYGCGSPVMDCGLEEGNTMVDLGSGMGVECFIASKVVGKTGRVIGVDMSDIMLQTARNHAREVAQNLGYSNVEFRKGFLEEIPVEDNSVDIVISNCVVNLSPDKRRTFAEISRILKPGGRLFISDIATDDPVPVEIQYAEKLRGECIGGALHMPKLKGILFDLSFESFYLHKRFLYRIVKDHSFFSITYSAEKPGPKETRTVVYRGPFSSVTAPDGTLLEPGIPKTVKIGPGVQLGEVFFELDPDGNVVNIDQTISCDCCESGVRSEE